VAYGLVFVLWHRSEKYVFVQFHAHITPEIIEGKSKQSPASDVYALERVVLN
jgi:hypothetical protein